MSNLERLADELQTLDDHIIDDEFLKIVNIEPPKGLVKRQPMTNTDYMPIESIEWLLTKIFQKWRVEVKSTQLVLNAITVSVRLHYMHPISNEWEWQDGVGAMKVQVDKGSSASNLQAIKPDAIQMALPAAKSFAIKDAADHIGNVFGRNLNRKNAQAFDPTYTQEGKEQLEEEKAKMRERLNAGNTNKSK